MRKTLGWLIAGLVAAAMAVAWLRPGSVFPARAGSAASTAVTADPALAREYADLMRRVAALEEQMKQRAAGDAASAAALQQLGQQRMAANAPGNVRNVQPGGNLQQEEVRYIVPDAGPRPVVRLTVESVAAAASAGDPLIAPANVNGIQATTGQVLVFRVTGSIAGSVWGSDTYTDDSSIAAAAVHSGLLRPGETGTLMLTMQAGTESYPAVTRNGVSSQSFGAWGRGYTIQRLN